MRKYSTIFVLGGLLTAILLISASLAFAQVGPGAIQYCRDLAFSVEEDFVTQGPVPPGW